MKHWLCTNCVISILSYFVKIPGRFLKASTSSNWNLCMYVCLPVYMKENFNRTLQYDRLKHQKILARCKNNGYYFNNRLYDYYALNCLFPYFNMLLHFCFITALNYSNNSFELLENLITLWRQFTCSKFLYNIKMYLLYKVII